MKRTLIVLDAGHGGQDLAGNYTTPPDDGKYFDHTFPCHLGNRFLEGVFNRQMAAKVAAELQARGFQTQSVYHGWMDNSLDSRTDQEQQLVKLWGGPSLFLSMHANAALSKARGLTLWTFPGSKGGQQLAKALYPLKGIFEAWGSYRSKNLYTEDYHILKHSRSPAMILELGFFDQPDDAKLLLNQNFQKEVAQTIARLIDNNYE